MKSTLTEQQLNLLNELYSRGSYLPFRDTVREKTLSSEQTRCVAHALIAKSALFNVDTGLGKTIMATSIINILKVVDPTLKWIFICPCNNLRSTYRKLSDGLFNSSVEYCDATEDRMQSIFFSRRASTADIMVLSYEASITPLAEDFLFRNRNIFRGIFIDEAHYISNMTSHTSQLLNSIVDNCEYRFALTATPLRIKIDQEVNIVHMLDRKMFGDVEKETFLNYFRIWEDRQVVGYKNLETLKNILAPRVIFLSRKELGLKGNYRPVPHLVNVRGDYSNLPTALRYSAIRKNENEACYEKITAVVLDYIRQGKIGVVYANRNIIKKKLKTILEEAGVRVAILDGKNTNTQLKKDRVNESFLAGNLDVVITNITVGRDLPANYVLFFELTFDYSQMIGRCERGLKGNDMDIVFILLKEKSDMEFFYHNVYKRGILSEKLCGKDVGELRPILNEIEKFIGSSVEDLQ